MQLFSDNNDGILSIGKENGNGKLEAQISNFPTMNIVLVCWTLLWKMCLSMLPDQNKFT